MKETAKKAAVLLLVVVGTLTVAWTNALHESRCVRWEQGLRCTGFSQYEKTCRPIQVCAEYQ